MRGSKTSSPEKQKPSPRPERRVQWTVGVKRLQWIVVVYFWSWESNGYFPPGYEALSKDYLKCHYPLIRPYDAGCWHCGPFNFHDGIWSVHIGPNFQLDSPWKTMSSHGAIPKRWVSKKTIHLDVFLGWFCYGLYHGKSTLNLNHYLDLFGMILLLEEIVLTSWGW